MITVRIITLMISKYNYYYEVKMQNSKIDLAHTNFGYAIGKTAHYLKMVALTFFKEEQFMLTPEQFFTLYFLYKEDGINQRQLARIALKDRPNITRILDILEKNNFVHREVDPNNRRIYKVFITEEGKKKAETILPLFIEVQNMAKNGLTDEEIDSLIRILGKIRSNLEETFKLQI